MRRSLDGYVGRAIAGSVLAALLFFQFLVVLLDVLNNLSGYLDKADRLGMGTLELFGFLARYHLQLAPATFVTIAPFATVIGCMFAVARLMTQNELQPMLFVGRSMVRILRPALLCGLAMALSMGACWQWVVPRIAVDVTEAQTLLTGGERRIKNLVIEVRGEASFLGLVVREYEPEQKRMLEVSLLRQGAQKGDAVLVTAEAATWDAERGDWRLEGGMTPTAEGDRPCEWLGAPEWTPSLVLQRGQDDMPCELFSYDELLETRAQRPNRTDVAIALHRHITYPLANLVLLLLALPFAIHFERGSRIERVLYAIGVCAGYLVFDLTCQNLGYNGQIRPVIAAWAPTILFGSLGVVLFGSIKS